VLEISFLQGSSREQVAKEQEDNNRYFAAEEVCRKNLKTQNAGQAEADCKRALDLVAKLPTERVNERRAANQLVGQSLFSQRKFEESLLYCQRELEIGKANMKPYEAELGYAYHHVALAYQTLGKANDAKANYDLAESTLVSARQHMDSDFLKGEYTKTLRNIWEHYLTLAKQLGQTDLADSLERRIRSDK